MALEFVAIDFETANSSPASPCAVGLVRVKDGFIQESISMLFKPPYPNNWFHEGNIRVHGIHPEDVIDAPNWEDVLPELLLFTEGLPFIAHNASFDSKFWQAELALAGLPAPQPFACTVLLSRRLYPQAPSHKLGSLVDYHGLPRTGQAHRALADAEMAANLTCFMAALLRERHGIAEISHELLCNLQRVPAAKMSLALQKIRDHAFG